MFKLAAMFKSQRRTLASLFTAFTLSACASPSRADNIYINTMISGELMPGVYGQVNIGSVPDYVTVYEEPMIIVPQPVYAVPLQPIYLYVPPYHAYHWRDHCGYYNACARPVYFVCARDYRPHYFESRYYNTRYYDPPRAYHHHHDHHRGHGHNRHYETMHQREMNRDSRYYRTNDDRGNAYRNNDDRRRYYRDDNPRDNNRVNDNHRNNNGQRNDYRPDNNRRDNHQDQRGNGDRNQQRQQLINNQRNDGNRQQFVRQYNSNPQPQRNDTARVRTDSARGNDYRRDVRPAEYRQSSANQGAMRERAQVPVQQARQPAYRPQAQESRSVSRHQGGGQAERRHEDRRER